MTQQFLSVVCSLLLLISSAVAVNCHCDSILECANECVDSEPACSPSPVAYAPECCAGCGFDDPSITSVPLEQADMESLPAPAVSVGVYPHDCAVVALLTIQYHYSRPPPDSGVRWQAFACTWLV